MNELTIIHAQACLQAAYDSLEKATEATDIADKKKYLRRAGLLNQVAFAVLENAAS